MHSYTSSNRLCKLRTDADDELAEDEPPAVDASAVDSRLGASCSFCSSNITCLKKLTGGT